MSARTWRQRLEECQQKLGHSVTTAQEWKLVAENRLELLRRIDRSLVQHMDALKDAGDIFGVGYPIDQEAWTDTIHFDGGTVASYIMGKIEAASLYTRELIKEASSIQVTLSDTYDHACAALQVGRPTQDLTIPTHTTNTSAPSSPLRDMVAELNNDADDTDEPVRDIGTVYNPANNDVIISHAEQALALFSKK